MGTSSYETSTTDCEAKTRRPATERQLLEAAGHVFAEKGFYQATGKEICRRAGANPAAINYYFRGIDGLYRAVVREAHDRLVTYDTLSAAVAGKADAKAKLRTVYELLIGVLTGPTSKSWVLRVLGREIVAPSAALAVIREKEFLPKVRVLKAIVGDLMELPHDHPAVARGCLTVMAPCFMLLVGDRQTLKRAFPNFGFTAKDSPTLVKHLVEYALAGLAAVARR